jgi:hypothetical protein
MAGRKKCVDCGNPGDERTLKKSLFRFGEWICKNRTACDERIQRKIQGIRGNN